MIAFLHTAPAHVATFEALLDAADPSVPRRHVVDATLLADARAAGAVTAAIAQRVAGAVAALAEPRTAVVLCTCSTIGGAAEAAPVTGGVTVLRVDRPMAERAIALGGRIAVVAALSTTIGPTADLLRDVAQRAGRRIEIAAVICADAWPYFERGDMPGYLDRLARALERAAGQCDVIVLAQASMAAAVERATHLAVPVLSSPRLGVEAAVRAYRARSCQTRD